MKFLAIPSLRWRLVAIMCLAYVIVALTTLAAGYRSQENNLRSQLDMRARSDAAILAAGSVGNLSGAGDLGTLRTFVSSLKKAQGVSYAVVVVEGGRVVGST